MSQRVLGLLPERDDILRRSKLRAFRRFVLLFGAIRSWMWLALDAPLEPVGLGATAFWLTLCFGLALPRRTELAAPRLALPALAVQLYWTLPFAANHFFLELYAVALLALIGGRRRDEEALVWSALCWLGALVLFHAGLQKVLYGYYFRGEFLSYLIAVSDRFADFFGLLLPAEEVARLRSYESLRTGSGPYRVDSNLLLLLSNAVWVAEISVAPLMLLARTARIAAVAAIGLVLAVQLGAREVGFALLFTNLLLIPAAGTTGRRLLPVEAAFLLWWLLAIFGWLPGRSFFEALHL